MIWLFLFLFPLSAEASFKSICDHFLRPRPIPRRITPPGVSDYVHKLGIMIYRLEEMKRDLRFRAPPVLLCEKIDHLFERAINLAKIIEGYHHPGENVKLHELLIRLERVIDSRAGILIGDLFRLNELMEEAEAMRSRL